MEKDGVTYLIVNDSAAGSDETVRREYRADQFLQAWHQRLAYIVRPGLPRDGGHAVPGHEPATFEPTGNTRVSSGVEQTEFTLKDANGNPVSLSNLGRGRYMSITYRKNDGPVQYVMPTLSQTLWFDTAKIAEEYSFTILFTGGRVYRASLK